MSSINKYFGMFFFFFKYLDIVNIKTRLNSRMHNYSTVSLNRFTIIVERRNFWCSTILPFPYLCKLSKLVKGSQLEYWLFKQVKHTQHFLPWQLINFPIFFAAKVTKSLFCNTSDINQKLLTLYFLLIWNTPVNSVLLNFVSSENLLASLEPHLTVPCVMRLKCYSFSIVVQLETFIKSDEQTTIRAILVYDSSYDLQHLVEQETNS